MASSAHILVVRLSALGDIAMSIPVLRVFTATYPEVQLTVLSRKSFEPLFADLKGVHFLEADVTNKHKGIPGLIRLAKEAKSTGITHVVDLHDVIRSKVISKYLKIQGLKTARIDKGRTEKKALTSAQGKPIIQLKSTHQRYADAFEKLGYPIDLSLHEFPPRRDLSKRLLNVVGKHGKKLIGIAPFAAFPGKVYPLESMKQVMRLLAETDKYQVFLFGGGHSEEEILQQWEHDYMGVINIAGQLTFEEELDLISNIDLMLSMDSGNGHLAAMLGIPVITLWGVTHPFAGFTPFGQPMEHQLLSDRNEFPLIPTSIYGNKLPEGYEKVMSSISPESVVVKINGLLSQ